MRQARAMKKLIERFSKGGNGGDTEFPSDDSRFFTTMFMERGEEAQLVVPWQSRAADIGAKPFDRKRGVELFARAWGADRYLAALSAGDAERLAQYLDFVSVDANTEVIGQDEQGDYMLVVLEGLIAVDRVQPWGGKARLAEARAGDMLGEMSLLDAGTRFSACTTLKPSVLAVIDAQRLDDLIHQEPALGLALLASLARRLSLRLRQVSARLSALLSQQPQ
jgi:CRP/FNR family transcriptional regulator, cyclic AMP receptor protein